MMNIKIINNCNHEWVYYSENIQLVIGMDVDLVNKSTSNLSVKIEQKNKIKICSKCLEVRI